MTTGYPPSSGDNDATIAADGFAPSHDLQRIAATRPDLHPILAVNPATPQSVLDLLAHSDNVAVKEALARRSRQGTAQTDEAAPPAQSQASEQIDAMAPTMAVGAARPQQSTGYGSAPQGYGTVTGASGSTDIAQPPGADRPISQPSVPSASPVAQPGPRQTGSIGYPAMNQPAMGAPPGQPAFNGPPVQAAPALRPKRRRGATAVAVFLPIILVLAATGGACWYFFGPSDAKIINRHIELSDDWKDGSVKKWDADVAASATPLVVGDHFLTYESSNHTLTAYTIADSGMTKAWDLEVGGDSSDPSTSFESMAYSWGDDKVVYGPTIIDLSSGKQGSVPWSESQSAIIADGIAISCDTENQCTAWESPQKKKWTITIPAEDGVNFSSMRGNVNVVTHKKHKYITINNVVLDLADGKTKVLGGDKAKATTNTDYAEDGWVVYEKNALNPGPDDPWSVVEYDLDGKQLSAYFVDPKKEESPLIYPEHYLLTIKQIHAYHKKNESPAPMTGLRDSGSSCINMLVPKVGKSFTIPNLEKKKENEAFCASGATLSPKKKAVKLKAQAQVDPNAFLYLMDVKREKQVEFAGIFWERGDSLIVVKPDLIIGYMRDLGKARGYKPEL